MSLIDAIKQPLEVGAPDGIATDADLAAINRHSARTLNADEVYVLPCVMSTPAVNGYALRMGQDSLERFASDASRGTPVHIQHGRLSRSMGYTYAGHYDPSTGEARAAAFLLRGRTIDDGAGGKLSSNQEIADIGSGMRREVSVGPSGPFAEMTCDVCGKELMSGFWEDDGCLHVPGMKTDDGTYATATVHNADLCELSLVDKGADPGALIGRAATGSGTVMRAVARPGANPSPVGKFTFAAPLAAKAQRLYKDGRIALPAFREWMDARALADPTVFHSVPAPQAPQEKPMNLAEVKARMRQLGNCAGLTAILPDGDALTADKFADSVQTFVAGEIDRAKRESMDAHPIVPILAEVGIKTADDARLAIARMKDGAAYADSVKKELEKQANRLFGADKGTLRFKLSSHLPVADMSEIAEDWKSQADEKFGVGKDRASKPTKLASARYAAGVEGEEAASQSIPDLVNQSIVQRYAKPDFSRNGGSH